MCFVALYTRYLEECEYDESKGKQVLEKLRAVIFNQEEKYYKKENFIELFKLEDDWGIVIVDQADGIFPLVLYTEKRDDVEHTERVSAFLNSVDELMSQYESIFQFLKCNQTDEWDINFQENYFVKLSLTIQLQQTLDSWYIAFPFCKIIKIERVLKTKAKSSSDVTRNLY